MKHDKITIVETWDVRDPHCPFIYLPMATVDASVDDPFANDVRRGFKEIVCPTPVTAVITGESQ
jgi:hypothetical protein